MGVKLEKIWKYFCYHNLMSVIGGINKTIAGLFMQRKYRGIVLSLQRGRQAPAEQAQQW